MEEQIKIAMISCGISPPDSIVIDGNIHRFGKSKSGWYIFFGDGIPAGTFGDWKTGSSHDWYMPQERTITPEEFAANEARMAEAKRIRDEERDKAQEDARQKAVKIWDSALIATDHPYLTTKGIKPHGTKIHNGNIVVPLYDESGKLCSLQFIDDTGEKRFLSNGKVKDCYFRIGKPNGTICIAEGFATAATVNQATGYAVIVAFNAGKLVDAAKFVRARMPEVNIIICADVDKVGIEKAEKAAEAVNGAVVFPDFGEMRTEKETDFNDLYIKSGIDAVRKTIIKDIPQGNVILDSDVKYSSVDILRHVDDSHIIKRLALHVSEKTYLPPSTVMLSGLSVFSSIACRKYSISYQDKEKLPIGLYVVTEQPSGSGKSRCLKMFQKPFYEMSEKIHDEIRIKYAKLAENEGSLNDDEKQELAILNARLRSLGSLFTTNATPEALEKGLLDSNGFFSAISSEQGLFNALFGMSYKSDARANNNDVVLNGFDGGYINSARVTRKGYCGHVVGGVTCFAQSGSIESLLNSSNGTGLSERFLMLAEPHNLGVRDHEKESDSNGEYYQEYSDKCSILSDVIESCDKFQNTIDLYIGADGFELIQKYKNKIEPMLLDGGEYSHSSLRGAASKIDMQIMKIAANLSLLDETVNFWGSIDTKYVQSAILIADDLLKANLKLCQDKGILGNRAEFESILRLFEDNAKPRIERAIIMSRSKVRPFSDFSGNRSDRIRAVLKEMVEQKILLKTVLAGITTYTAI